MDAIALTTIIVYLVAATTAGSLMARRARNSTGWAVAGGGMSTMLIAVGIAGTRTHSSSRSGSWHFGCMSSPSPEKARASSP
jgi:Na+/proline symporter